MRTYLLSLAAVTLSTMSAFAMSDNDLRVALEQRFKGDRTGACVAAAVIDNGTTASAYVCADPKSHRPYDEHTAFEIGSVTKTMTAALLPNSSRAAKPHSAIPLPSCCRRERACRRSTVARSPSATSSLTRPACRRSRGA